MFRLQEVLHDLFTFGFVAAGTLDFLTYRVEEFVGQVVGLTQELRPDLRQGFACLVQSNVVIRYLIRLTDGAAIADSFF